MSTRIDRAVRAQNKKRAAARAARQARKQPEVATDPLLLRELKLLREEFEALRLWLCVGPRRVIITDHVTLGAQA